MTNEISDEVRELHRKLTECLNIVKLGVASRYVYFDKPNNMFILALSATSPGKVQEAAALAWNSIPPELKVELQLADIGFAGRMI